MTYRPGILLLLTAGFVVWSAIFVGLYAGLSVGCAAGWSQIPLGPISLLRVLLIGGLLAGMAALFATVLILRRMRPADGSPVGFVNRASFYAAIVATAAGGFTFAPVLFTSPCI